MSIEQAWQRTEPWEEPEPLPEEWILNREGKMVKIHPHVGVAMPERIKDKQEFERILKRAWYGRREKSWDMLPLTRDAWFDLIMEDWESWNRRIRLDMTPRFKKQVKKLLRKGGFVLVIGGNPSEQGDGKSIAGLMVCDMLWHEFGIRVHPNVLFEHSHMKIVLEEHEGEWVILDIDEDLEARGEGSGTILVEISNTKQTNRKTKLIIISIGIDPKGSHPAVNIHLIPCGINEKFQATRFAMFKRGRFKGWVVLQRKYRPDMLVRFGTEQELDTVDTYEHRAAYHSSKVARIGIDAFPPEVREMHIESVIEWLEMDKQKYEDAEQKWTPPAIPVMVNEAAIKVQLPIKPITYPRGICQTALRRFMFENPGFKKERTETVDLSKVRVEMVEFWEDYQAVVYSRYPEGYQLADRDAWMVTYAQMGYKHAEIKDILGLTMRINSVGERIRTGVSEWNVLPSKTQLGTIGEKFIGSRIDSLGGGRTVYARTLEESARKDVPDISDTGLTRNASWAVNVKVSMEHDFDRVFETSPEHEVRRSWAAFLFPKTAEIALCDIVGENTRFNSADMVLCGIVEGVKRLRELIDDA